MTFSSKSIFENSQEPPPLLLFWAECLVMILWIYCHSHTIHHWRLCLGNFKKKLEADIVGLECTSVQAVLALEGVVVAPFPHIACPALLLTTTTAEGLCSVVCNLLVWNTFKGMRTWAQHDPALFFHEANLCTVLSFKMRLIVTGWVKAM